jgi:hypothetical protein
LDKVRLPATVVADAEGYEQVQQAAEAAASRGRPGAPEAAADHLLRVSQSPVVFLPSGMGGRLVLERLPTAFSRDEDTGRRMLDDAAQRWGVAQRRVAGELFPLFVANQRRGLRSGFDAGDLSPHAPLLLGAGLYDRLYERRALPTRRNYAVSLLVDGSASMLQPRPVAAGRSETWGLSAAILGAWTLAHLCEELQVSFEVGIFNRGFAALAEDTEALYLRRRAEATAGLRQAHGSSADALVSTVNHYLVKSFDDPWRTAEARLVGLADMAFRPKEAGQRATRHPQESAPVSMFAKAANVDELNVVRAVERLAARRANVRVLVVLSDGMTRGRPGELALAVGAAERAGATVLGIGIGDRAVEASYRHAQVVYRPPALARAMVEGVRGALKRGLARAGVPVGT